MVYKQDDIVIENLSDYLNNFQMNFLFKIENQEGILDSYISTRPA